MRPCLKTEKKKLKGKGPSNSLRVAIQNYFKNLDLSGVISVAQQVKVFVTKPDNLNLIPRSCPVKGPLAST